MVREGDGVREDDPLAEVETDKAIIEIPSPVDGVVGEIHASEGETVAVGDRLVTFEQEGEAGPARNDGGVEILDSDGNAAVDVDTDEPEEKEVETEEGDGVFASSSTRRLAREVGVDIEEVEGSGEDGRIVAQDVLHAAKEMQDEREEERETPKSDEERTHEDEEPTPEFGQDEAPAVEPETAEETSMFGDGETPTFERDTVEDEDEGEDEDPTPEFGQDEAPAVEPETAEETSMFGDFETSAFERESEETEKGVSDEDDESTPEFGRDETPTVEPETADETGMFGEDTSEKVSPEEDIFEGEAEEKTGRGGTKSGEVQNGGEGLSSVDAEDSETEVEDGVAQQDEVATREGHVTRLAAHQDTADAEGLMDVRDRLRDVVDARLTYTPLLVKACAVALEEHQVFNRGIDEETGEPYLKDRIDVGVTTETDDGVVTPVVESVGEKGVAEIAGKLDDLKERAKTKGLTEDETGCSFALTNVGAIGGEGAVPVVRHPETAAVAVGEIRQRPRVVGGEVVPRHTAPLSVTFDGRIADSAAAARFMNDLKRYLREPAEMLL
jgi:pyruvate dehydrogenase E2 component (dihydrolipoamide acetyltransferase)